MKNRNIKIFFFALLLLGATIANAQQKPEVGITAGVARFYPQSLYFGTSADQMSNGPGWTAGAFIQQYLSPKVQQILEINYVTMSSDISMEQVPTGPWGHGDGQPAPIREDFRHTPFTSLSVSLGGQYYLTKKLFAYPAFVLARSLNQNMTMNATDYRVKVGLGLKLKKAHVILEYAYGLRDQSRVLDPAVPFQITTRTKYLQLKVQVPLIRLK